MPVKVSFMRPGYIGSLSAFGVGDCRICETVTVPGSTTATLQDGEIAVLVSTEASEVVVAHGTAPDAAATAMTSTTSAGYAMGAREGLLVAGKAGDKINIKAFV